MPPLYPLGDVGIRSHRTLLNAALNERAQLFSHSSSVKSADEHLTRSLVINNPRSAERRLREWSLSHGGHKSFAVAVNYARNAEFLTQFERDALFQGKARFLAFKVRVVSRSR